tara:strand:+ start:350 stop:802 length:453 start_codon:yes stop_codon:yes gene_type:complete
MGHFNSTNLQKLFLKRLYAKGKLSITDMVWHCKEKEITAEGNELPEGRSFSDYFDDYWYHYDMILEEVIFVWLGESWKQCEGIQLVPILEDPAEVKIWEMYNSKGTYDYIDIFNDASTMEYIILHNIRWKFAKSWRKKYKEIPLLGHFSL